VFGCDDTACSSRVFKGHVLDLFPSVDARSDQGHIEILPCQGPNQECNHPSYLLFCKVSHEEDGTYSTQLLRTPCRSKKEHWCQCKKYGEEAT
jgi:hypothetical protein